jgi:hypothetical protein
MFKRFLTIWSIIAVTSSAFCGSAKITSKNKGKDIGPTVYLDYENQEQKANSVEVFMYFVPMISTVLVDSENSPENSQKVRIVSTHRESTRKGFEVVCEFEMWGEGFHENMFDAKDIIAKDQDSVPNGKPLKNIIDFIRFEGGGHGRIEVKGTKNNGIEQVTEVKVIFNHDDTTSPVTVGLYNMKPENGEYKYENRSDRKKARVNSLSFEAGDDPRMDISLASLGGLNKNEGFYSRLKGKIANLFIEPVRINPEGNKAMLDFGYALYKKQASFTFPKAQNLKLKEGQQQEPVFAKAEHLRKPDSVTAN